MTWTTPVKASSATCRAGRVPVVGLNMNRPAGASHERYDPRSFGKMPGEFFSCAGNMATCRGMEVMSSNTVRPSSEETSTDAKQCLSGVNLKATYPAGRLTVAVERDALSVCALNKKPPYPCVVCLCVPEAKRVKSAGHVPTCRVSTITRVR